MKVDFSVNYIHLSRVAQLGERSEPIKSYFISNGFAIILHSLGKGWFPNSSEHFM